MSFCVNCGQPLGEGQKFCPSCGAAVGQASAGTGGTPVLPSAEPQSPTPVAPATPAPPPPGYAAPAPGYAAPAPPPPGYGPSAPPAAPIQPGYAPYGQPTPPYGAYGQQPPRSHKGLWISLVAGVLVVAIACVLVFVVFKDDIFGGGGAASTPEKTVSRLLQAMEARDIDAMFSLMEEKALGAALGGMSKDQAKQMMKGVMLEYRAVKFSGIKMKTENTGDATATVSIIAGTVTITDNSGKKTSEDVKDADEPPSFDVMKVDGKWYLDPNSLGGLTGMEGGAGSTTSETTSTVPPSTETTDEGGGNDTGSTDTTVGGVGIKAVGSDSPEAAVTAFLDAMHKKDVMGVLQLMDPQTVEGALGMSLDEAQQTLGEELFNYQAVSFSGIKLNSQPNDDGTVTVTIAEGTATLTGTDGQTKTEDATDSGEPISFTLVQRDGLWYIDPTGLF